MMAATVHWTTGEPASERPDDAWWQTLIDAEGLRLDRKRVILYVARHARSRVVTETARGLATFLHRVAGVTVEILDGADIADGVPGARRLDLDAGDRLRVDAVCLRGGAMIPTLWLDDFTLVTITGAAADERYGIAGILTAQAELLSAADSDDLGLVFEAHRLLAADLGVVCGTRTAGATASGSWWAAGTDDVALEHAVATAGGADPTTLPLLRFFARHEIASPVVATSRAPFPLEGYVAPENAVRAARARARTRRIVRIVREDVGLAAANLHRIPDFIGRRWPRLLQLVKGAA